MIKKSSLAVGLFAVNVLFIYFLYSNVSSSARGLYIWSTFGSISRINYYHSDIDCEETFAMTPVGSKHTLTWEVIIEPLTSLTDLRLPVSMTWYFIMLKCLHYYDISFRTMKEQRLLHSCQRLKESKRFHLLCFHGYTNCEHFT